MCVCMCVYVLDVQFVHTWVHRMQCTFVHFRYVCARVCVCVCVCMCVCTGRAVGAHLGAQDAEHVLCTCNLCVCMCVYACMCVCVCMRVCVYVHVCMLYVCMCKCAYWTCSCILTSKNSNENEPFKKRLHGRGESTKEPGCHQKLVAPLGGTIHFSPRRFTLCSRPQMCTTNLCTDNNKDAKRRCLVRRHFTLHHTTKIHT